MRERVAPTPRLCNCRFPAKPRCNDRPPDRYRATTAALGYTGDSVINSVSDILMMCLGFLLARKLPVWASIALLIVLELVPLAAIRDNLTLNIWMLLAPSQALQAWQSGA